jgi:iron complex outermembrane receptor protein
MAVRARWGLTEGTAEGRAGELAGLICVSLAAAAHSAPAQASVTTASDLKKLSVEELLDMPVTLASRRPMALLDTPAAIQVITSEDIGRSAATRLPEALRLAPNLTVAQLDSSNWAISARGFNTGLGNKLLVMVDGRTVYTPMFAGVFWDTQDAIVEDIDRIEIVSGPGGSVWGANAVNGVIGVVTRSAADTQGLLLKAGAGGELDSYGAARYGGAIGRNGNYRVYGKYTGYDASALPTGVPHRDAAHSGRGGFRLDTPFGEGDTLTVQGDYFDGASGEVSAGNRVEFDGWNMLGRWKRSLSDTSGMTLQIYYDNSFRRIAGRATDTVDTVDVDFENGWRLGSRHNVVWGLGFRSVADRFISQPGFAFLPEQVTSSLFSAFVQDEIDLAGNGSQLTLGTKVEHNDYTGFEVQPTLSLALKPADDQTVWASISRAIRAPARIDRDLYIPSQPPYSIAGGPDFESEVLLAYEAGYRVRLGNRALLDLTTFYNDYDKLRSVESANPPAQFPFVVRNGLRGQAHGGELNADVQIADRWRVTAGYRYTKLRLRAKSGSLDTTSVRAEARDSPHAFTLRSMLDITSTLQLDATYRSVARIAVDAVPGYEELDVRLAWRAMKKLEIAIVGQNLLHDRHAEFNPLASRREIERSVYGNVTWGY